MGARTKYYQDKARAEKIFKTVEDLDAEQGWIILNKFKTKTAMAVWVSNPDNLADLEFRYPLRIYRRKLDIDRNYIAVLRK
jgi:hypothetical protein